MPQAESNSRYAQVLVADFDIETARITSLAAASDPISIRRLTELDAPSAGWNCLDVGAGPGTLTRWMAAQASFSGAGGKVVALDTNTEIFGDPGTVDVVRGDATSLKRPDWEGHFDLVHARFTLMHLPRRRQALDAMIKWARPGGLIVISDASPTQPTHPAVAAAMEVIWEKASALVGTDPTWAQTVPRILAEAGLWPCGSAIDVPLIHGRGPLAKFVQLTYELLTDPSEDPSLAYALNKERMAGGAFAMVTSWGRRPLDP